MTTNLLGNVLLLSVAFLVLAKSVSMFINSSTKIARRFKLSGYTISFLLIGTATSLPELVVGITSAINKTPMLSYANVMGSNMALLTLIVALPVMLGAHISTRHIIQSKDLYISIFFFVSTLALTIDGKLTRADGVILIAGYLIYTVSILKKGSNVEKFVDSLGQINIWKQAVIFVISLLLLIGSSEMIVKLAISISDILRWRLVFVGVSITALGTSLPEIVHALKVMNNPWQKEGILGNIMGSVVTNSSLVLGVTSLITPISINSGNINVPTLTILVTTLLLFLFFARTKNKLEKFEAVALIAIYVIFLSLEYILTV